MIGPSTVLVTGGAGFIGAVVSRRLADAGHQVIVADYGSDDRHRRALASLDEVGITCHDIDLRDADLTRLLAGVDRVVHLAGRPGVQTSWADGFADHLDLNIALTQRLLEAALVSPVERIVFASSSSVYGDVPSGFATEDRLPTPLSPYGVSKAAAEMLIGAYAARGVPVMALRYFTVYGRGQRPDMALHRVIDAALGGPAFPLRGNGLQARDVTHVDDVVAATVAATFAELPAGVICNVGSGRPVTLRSLINEVARQIGRPVPMTPEPAPPGDPGRTAADCRRADGLLGWRPAIDLAEGIADQIRHHPRFRVSGTRVTPKAMLEESVAGDRARGSHVLAWAGQPVVAYLGREGCQ